ncbi:MAG: ribosome maturation factor RimP [Cytophagales bacterium]|nr:ribosome maturation factor RimP [Cytophagales bacterium]
MDLKDKIVSLAESNLEESHFLVDVVISAKRGPKKVLILLDGDHGVTIDHCARLSRILGQLLDEEELIDDKYMLEVSSPGVDYPITLDRQYRKNIGRNIKVSLKDGTEAKGKLMEVNENGILLDREKKKGKKMEYELSKLLFLEIDKSIVQVSFKQ